MTQISEEYQKRLMNGDSTLILPMLAYYGTGRLWDDHREKRSEKYRENTRVNGYIDCLDGRVQIPLEQLSDGYRCALSLIGDIAHRMATLNPQLEQDVLTETPGIVLIDEVDLHLHPEWQQHILKDLTDTFPKIQFIVTTHAPAIINSTAEGALLVIEENNVDYLGSGAYGQDINTIVKSYMNASVRPSEIQHKFDDLYHFLDENKIEEAKKVLGELKEKIDINDTELTSCIVKIKLAERKIKK